VISAVEPGSPAAKAGLAKGDVVTAIDGAPIRSASHLRNIVGLKDPRTGRFRWVGFSKFEADERFVRNRQLWPGSNNGVALSDWLYDMGLDGEYPEPVLLARVDLNEVTEHRREWITRVEQEQGYTLSGAKPVENIRKTKKKEHPPRRVDLRVLEGGKVRNARRKPVEGGRKAAHREHALIGRKTA